MFSKCANPECSTRLLYLREGKVFKLEVPNTQQSAPAGPQLLNQKKPVSATHVEHFWLCGPCSKQFTLRNDPEQGVTTVPLTTLVRRAVAS